MKKIFLFLFAGLLCCTLSYSKQDTGNNEGLINALMSGNASAISQYFDDVLDIKLPGKEEAKNIGKNQAGILLRSFYDNKAINGFTLTSKREMGGTMYIAGKITGREKSYNITLMLHSKNGQSLVISARIN